ncbi:hypothetical protein EVAR_78566_1 [Eumeta japonica]|uniref:Uncharacterized protein n=1 Tax=Eumeta variegata TaxID=151549 RepID=A0A4C1W769_EUMVA|nr:hypothetical protein EVAR_78566_1 [Eumeta japonica]
MGSRNLREVISALRNACAKSPERSYRPSATTTVNAWNTPLNAHLRHVLPGHAWVQSVTLTVVVGDDLPLPTLVKR